MAKFSIREIYDAARTAGFSPDQAATWTAIALAESGGRSSALNDQGEHSMGLWQINVDPKVRANHWGNLNDPRVNARAAFEVSGHGRDMRPWTTTHAVNKGTARDYRTYLDEVEAAVGVKGDWRGVQGYGAPLPPPLAATTASARTADPPPAGYDQAVAARPVGTQRDTDHDGLVDEFERFAGTDLRRADTDLDGLSDGYEIATSHSNPLSADGDKDNLSDATEASLGTNPMRLDSDDDGLTDLAEVRLGSDATTQDAGTGLPAQPDSPARVVPPAPDARQAVLQTKPAAPHAVKPTPSVRDRFVEMAMDQRGDPYIYGAETKMSDDDPDAFDCSELTQWAAHQVGVKIPDGAEWQYLDLKERDSLIPVDQALKTKGALLFYFSHEPTSSGPRPGRAHVAISLGDGRTIEARGRAYGVNEFAAKHRFNYAGVVPGLGGSESAPSPEPPPPPPLYDRIASGAGLGTAVDTDADGLTDDFERLAGTRPNAADSDSDGLSDAYEAIRSHTDPLSADTDRDNVPDPNELALGSDPGRLAGVAGVSGRGAFAQNIRAPLEDADADGLSDAYEKKAGLDPRRADSDSDGLADSFEASLGSDGTKVDTDLDGMTDYLEVQLGSNPLGPGTGLEPTLGPGGTTPTGLPTGLPGVPDLAGAGTEGLTATDALADGGEAT